MPHCSRGVGQVPAPGAPNSAYLARVQIDAAKVHATAAAGRPDRQVGGLQPCARFPIVAIELKVFRVELAEEQQCRERGGECHRGHCAVLTHEYPERRPEYGCRDGAGKGAERRSC